VVTTRPSFGTSKPANNTLTSPVLSPHATFVPRRYALMWLTSCLSGHTDSVTCARFNRDGKLVATAGLDASVKIWNTENGQLVNTLEGPGEGLEVHFVLGAREMQR